jgi:hypothetical protein
MPLKLTISFVLVIGTKSLQTAYWNFKEISRKLCIQSKEFREILMSKMGNFYFENGSTTAYGSWKARLSKSKLEVRLFYSSKIWIKFGSWKARRLNRAWYVHSEFFLASERHSTFDAGLVTKFGTFSSLNFPKLI